MDSRDRADMGRSVLRPYIFCGDVLEGEEVLEELFAAGGEDGFGVELDAFEFGAAVADAHDDAVGGFGSDGEFAREGFSLDDQRVVARGCEWV